MIVVFNYGSRTASIASWFMCTERKVMDLQLSLILGQPAICRCDVNSPRHTTATQQYKKGKSHSFSSKLDLRSRDSRGGVVMRADVDYLFSNVWALPSRR